MGRVSVGTLLALLVFLLALGGAIGVIETSHLTLWLIAILALAILVGGISLPWPTRLPK